MRDFVQPWHRPGRVLKTILLVASLFVFSASATAGELAQKLMSGNYVLLMRHANAPGTGDPNAFKLGDCGTQRNLDQRGRLQATRIGERLRAEGIGDAIVYSSPWCRCIDTANLLGFRKAVIEPSLASFYNDRAGSEQSTRNLQQFIARQINANTLPLILVTHEVNITAYADVFAGSGDMILVKVDANGKPISHQAYANQ
jgi:phosphohistidine phosphatase SixA